MRKKLGQFFTSVVQRLTLIFILCFRIFVYSYKRNIRKTKSLTKNSPSIYMGNKEIDKSLF